MVGSMNPKYVKYKRQWDIIRDCIEGELQIKSRNEKYLPRATGMTDAEYEAYKTRARFVNYTKRARDGLHGFLFRRDPTIDGLELLKGTNIYENIDRRGHSIVQFMSDCIHDGMVTTYGAVLVDLPRTNGKITALEKEQKNIRAYAKYYPAESIMDWRYKEIDGVEKLVMVELKETVDVSDALDHDYREQYRYLEIVDGKYRQRLVKAIAENGTQSEEIIPISVYGKEIDYIPFIPLFSEEPEAPMFIDLALRNIGHYQEVADYENGVHLTTIPTGYVTGHEINDNEDGEIKLGGDSFLSFKEETAKVGTLVFSGEGLTHSEHAIEKSHQDMSILATRLVAPEKSMSETADSAKIHRAGENAILGSLAKNASRAFSKMVNMILEWEGIDGTVKIQLCNDYDTLSFDPNALNAVANLSREGKIPLPYVFSILSNGEYLPSDATLEQYAVLLKLEYIGLDPFTVCEVYRDMKQGKDINWVELEKKAEEMKKLKSDKTGDEIIDEKVDNDLPDKEIK